MGTSIFFTRLAVVRVEEWRAQVRAEAVTVLKRAGNTEISCYLLQLSAALRYEPRDDSLLARFLVTRLVLRFSSS